MISFVIVVGKKDWQIIINDKWNECYVTTTLVCRDLCQDVERDGGDNRRWQRKTYKKLLFLSVAYFYFLKTTQYYSIKKGKIF